MLGGPSRAIRWTPVFPHIRLACTDCSLNGVTGRGSTETMETKTTACPLRLHAVDALGPASERSEQEAVFARTRGKEAPDCMPLPTCELLDLSKCHSFAADE